jgi:hypothetical protein
MACFPLLLPPHSRLAGSEEVKNYSFQIIQARDINHQCHHHYQSVSLERWSEIAIYHRGKALFGGVKGLFGTLGKLPAPLRRATETLKVCLTP